MQSSDSTAHHTHTSVSLNPDSSKAVKSQFAELNVRRVLHGHAEVQGPAEMTCEHGALFTQTENNESLTVSSEPTIPSL